MTSFQEKGEKLGKTGFIPGFAALPAGGLTAGEVVLRKNAQWDDVPRSDVLRDEILRDDVGGGLVLLEEPQILPQLIVLVGLFPEEAHGHARPLLDARGREMVDVGRLVVRGEEILGLDEPLFDQRAQQVIDLRQADAGPGGHLTLRHVRIRSDLAQEDERLVAFDFRLYGICHCLPWFVF